MFGEARLVTSYFQQMTLYSKIHKIIPNERSVNCFRVECELFWSGVSIILDRSVNYLIILEVECFLKNRVYQM